MKRTLRTLLGIALAVSIVAPAAQAADTTVTETSLPVVAGDAAEAASPLRDAVSSITAPATACTKRGKHKGAIVGAVVGGLAGAGFGFVAGSMACLDNEGHCDTSAAPKGAAVMGALGALGGALFGALIDAGFGPPRPAIRGAQHVTVAVAPVNRGMAGTVSIRF